MEVEDTRRRHLAVAESSDSDVSQEAREELASSHSSDDDERGEHDARGGYSRTSAKPADLCEDFFASAVCFLTYKHDTSDLPLAL